jgi:hypothetical protein
MSGEPSGTNVAGESPTVTGPVVETEEATATSP